MIYYANPSTVQIRDAMLRGQLGCIDTPLQQNIIHPADVDTIADNGCFSAKWEHSRWLRWLIDRPRLYRFVVAPDVFDPSGAPCHKETLERWRRYGPIIDRHGFVPAFVCQVGATAHNIPSDAPVLFLGGTTEWKLGEEARRITALAKTEGRWVHMGRVNSQRRLVTALEMGCDSVDGTFLTFGPDANLERLLRYMEKARLKARPPGLF